MVCQTSNRPRTVIEHLLRLNLPYDNYCVNYIAKVWECDHEEELKDDVWNIVEISAEDVKTYWNEYVETILFYLKKENEQ